MQFGVLGPLVVRSAEGDPVAVGGPRPRALLAMLLLDAGRLVSLDRLIDGQYGDRPPAGAANAVQAGISRLRRRLPDGLIEFHGTGYLLAVDREHVDAHRFERLAGEGRALLSAGRPGVAAGVLREGLALWRGPAFADLTGAPFAGPQARRLEELRLTASEDLYEAELALPGTAPEAGLRELVAAHPLRERARGLLMRALRARARQAEALAVYDEGRRLLAAELGADPSPELAALHLEILRGEERERPARPGVPAQLTSFVGREEELALLATALRTSRLVTIVGPGGTGKTRLAIEATARGPAGAHFVDLSLADPATPDPPPGTGTPGSGQAGSGLVTSGGGQAGLGPRMPSGGQVAQAVLGALGVREPALRPYGAGGPDPADRLVAALSGQDLLLILDNCEHVVAEAAALARRLLAHCPGLTILATSREPLGLTGERLIPLAPLPTPPPGAPPPADPLGYPAVRLFADRAAAVRQGFALDAGNLEAVSRICAALDGLPLAIELAAARVRTFGVAEIADRLAEHGRFRLLSRGDRTAAARHRTLHAVVEWSWSLLGPEEQALARRFSVFTGGATLEAVERVCAGPAPPAETAVAAHPVTTRAPAGTASAPQVSATDPLAGTADLAGVLADLVDKSLVETDGERYQMLDTIRLFCLERLAEAGEEERLRRAHAAWSLDLARRAHDHLYQAEQLEWLARLSADNANLQAALRWSVAHDRPTAWRLVATLAMYWWLSGRRGQAVRHAVRLLDSAERESGPEAEGGLAEEYVLAVLHAVPESGSPHWARAREIVESLDRPMRYRFGVALWGMIAGPPQDEVSAARGRRMLGPEPWSHALGRLSIALMSLLNGSVTEAEPELERVLAEFGAVGERWGAAQALDWLALTASWRGDWEHAFELWERALALLEELGALDELADVLGRRAGAHWRAGDARAARADYERAGELERRLGRPELMAWVQLQLGEMARFEGDLDEAVRRLEAALAGSVTGAFTSEGTRSRVLTALGRLAEANGDVAGAARRHAEALTAALGTPLAADLAGVAEGLAAQSLFEATFPSAPHPDERLVMAGAERAALLLGVAVALRGMAVAGDRDVAATTAGAIRVLGAEAFAAAYARGAAVRPDEAPAILRAAADGGPPR
ncbi:BTAD domain-containing putative transcriptional regulator [Nonomuraea candida]|uniref:BTAD domain-containing putative transcriptional regulator n=1 Tax=Nonomuraea candida TaxID=359159 RepID=UPI0005B98D8D|nr:BTAD domain-containing putative transcriptional regulator [Nonomuraea candida]